MFKTIRTVRKITRVITQGPQLPADNPVFRFWSDIEMYAAKGFTKRTKHPMVAPSGIDFIDALIQVQTPTGVGLSGGTWILIAGEPGSRKTTLGIQLLKSIADTNEGRVVSEHFDFEMGEMKAQDLYEDLGADDDSIGYLDCTKAENRSPDLLKDIRQRAADLKKEGKMLVVLIDSFEWLTERANDFDQQREIARSLREDRVENLIWITIVHLTKGGKTLAGANEIFKYCDIRLGLEPRGRFIYLTHPKNRDMALDAPDYVKLECQRPGPGLVPNNEPEFISNNPVINTVRGWFKKGKKNGEDRAA